MRQFYCFSKSEYLHAACDKTYVHDKINKKERDFYTQSDHGSYDWLLANIIYASLIKHLMPVGYCWMSTCVSNSSPFSDSGVHVVQQRGVHLGYHPDHNLQRYGVQQVCNKYNNTMEPSDRDYPTLPILWLIFGTLISF